MTRFRLSLQAARDIEEAWEYIAADSVRAASRVRLALLAACRRLARNPHMGHMRADLTDQPVRFWPVASYLVVYNPGTKPIEVVRVLHVARDIEAELNV
jgi:toxin ParE1/3/4